MKSSGNLRERTVTGTKLKQIFTAKNESHAILVRRYVVSSFIKSKELIQDLLKGWRKKEEKKKKVNLHSMHRLREHFSLMRAARPGFGLRRTCVRGVAEVKYQFGHSTLHNFWDMSSDFFWCSPVRGSWFRAGPG